MNKEIQCLNPTFILWAKFWFNLFISINISEFQNSKQFRIYVEYMQSILLRISKLNYSFEK